MPQMRRPVTATGRLVGAVRATLWKCPSGTILRNDRTHCGSLVGYAMDGNSALVQVDAIAYDGHAQTGARDSTYIRSPMKSLENMSEILGGNTSSLVTDRKRNIGIGNVYREPDFRIGRGIFQCIGKQVADNEPQ
jgi:hypothetical protein